MNKSIKKCIAGILACSLVLSWGCSSTKVEEAADESAAVESTVDAGDESTAVESTAEKSSSEESTS